LEKGDVQESRRGKLMHLSEDKKRPRGRKVTDSKRGERKERDQSGGRAEDQT